MRHFCPCDSPSTNDLSKLDRGADGGNQPILAVRAEWWQLSGWVLLFSGTEFSKISHLLELREQNHHTTCVELTLTTGSQQHMQGRCSHWLEFNLTVIMQKAVTSPRRGVDQNLIQTDHCKQCLNFFWTAFGWNQSLNVTGSEEGWERLWDCGIQQGPPSLRKRYDQ